MFHLHEQLPGSLNNLVSLQEIKIIVSIFTFFPGPHGPELERPRHYDALLLVLCIHVHDEPVLLVYVRPGQQHAPELTHVHLRQRAVVRDETLREDLGLGAAVAVDAECGGGVVLEDVLLVRPADGADEDALEPVEACKDKRSVNRCLENG